MVIFVGDKMIQRTVNSIVFARFYLNRERTEIVVIVNQVVDFTLIAVVVIIKFKAVGNQFACNYAFINRTQIDTFFII